MWNRNLALKLYRLKWSVGENLKINQSVFAISKESSDNNLMPLPLPSLGTAFFSISFLTIILQVPTVKVTGEPGRGKYVGCLLVMFIDKLQWEVTDFLETNLYPVRQYQPP